MVLCKRFEQIKERKTAIKRKTYPIAVRQRSGEFHELSAVMLPEWRAARKKRGGLKIVLFLELFPGILRCFCLLRTPETRARWHHERQNSMKFNYFTHTPDK